MPEQPRSFSRGLNDTHKNTATVTAQDVLFGELVFAIYHQK